MKNVRRQQLTSYTQNFYQQLMNRAKDLIVLSSTAALVHWDMETMMPPKAVNLRSEQLALLSSISHKMGTDPEIGRLLKAITKDPDYGSFGKVEKRNIHLIQKNYEEQTALPEKLVSETARQQAITVNTWKQAKAAKRFDILKPELEKLLDLNRQASEILMKVKQTRTPYDALVDIYEPKMTGDAITLIFNQLQQGLKELLEKIQAAPNQPDPAILQRKVPVEAQRKIAEVLSQTLGYETTTAKAGGRIDETEHPFTEGYYDDVRITTHYYPEVFASSVFSVLHETGHALYEQGLPQKWKYQPVGSPCSMGFHESQSRLWENIIGRSREFWTTLLPKLKQIAAPALDNLELAGFVRAINRVAPSKIRIEADEVTYSLHVIIRFQIEKELFNGKVSVSELPDLWNQKYAEYLGVKVQNDSEGVMQDTHWPSGLYGYFPTYALGNIYSGQITAALASALQNWRGQVAQGNLNGIREWLISNVYSFGDLYDPADLIKKVTGQSLDAEPYLRYLREKYGGLYGF
jgi:carboxypeptidase Taq